MFVHFNLEYSILFLSAVLLTASAAGKTEKTFLFPVCVNSKTGFIDQSGRIVIRPQFDEVSDFSEQRAAVKIGNDWGYIDQEGAVVVPPRFVSAEPFSESMACVMTHNGWGFINKEGNFVIPPSYSWAHSFSGGLARVGMGGSPAAGLFREPRFPDKWVLVDHTGKAVLSPEFDYVDDFHEGFALVAKRGKDRFLVNYINKEGRPIFVDWFVAGWKFSEGLAIVSSDLKGYTGEHFGRLVYDNFNMDPFDASGGINVIEFQLIDSSGNRVPAGQFENIADFSEGLAAVQTNGKWGYINKKGQMVIEPKFDIAKDFSEGLASVREGDKNYYIDASGRCVLRVNHDGADSFRNGLARVWDTGEAGYIDKSGKVVWKPTR